MLRSAHGWAATPLLPAASSSSREYSTGWGVGLEQGTVVGLPLLFDHYVSFSSSYLSHAELGVQDVRCAVVDGDGVIGAWLMAKKERLRVKRKGEEEKKEELIVLSRLSRSRSPKRKNAKHILAT